LDKEKIDLWERIKEGSLSEADKQLIFDLSHEVMNFFGKSRIAPTPENYSIWFLAFAYLREKGIRSPQIPQVFSAYDKVVEILDAGETKEQVAVESVSLNLGNEVKKILRELRNLLFHIAETLLDGKELPREELRFLNRLRVRLKENSLEKGDIDRLSDLVNQIDVKTGYTLKELNEKISSMEEKLAGKIKSSALDPVSGAMKLNIFKMIVRKLLRRKDVVDEPFTLLMIEVDNLVSINDKYGEEAGDLYLRKLVKVINNELRGNDFVAQYRGGTFLVLLRDVSIKTASRVAQRLKDKIDRITVSHKGEEFSATVSMGFAEAERKDTFETLLDKCEQALYLAKSEGKNCIRSYIDVLAREAAEKRIT
jgi:diguanylate cyclase